MDDQQPVSAGTPIYQESKEHNAKWLWFLIALIVIGAVVFAVVKGIGPFGGLGSGSSSETASPTPTTNLFASPSPQASPAASLDRSEPEIRVLNGSGTAGQASAMKDILEGKGWKVAAIGNAESYNFTQTVLKVKASFSEFAALLASDLSGQYSTTISDDRLDATDSADIEVTVGAK